MHSNIHFESGTEADAAPLAQVAHFLDQQNGKVQLTWAPESVHVLAKKDNRIIGGVFGATNWSWLYIKLLAIDPEFRNQGIGKSLMEQIERLAANRGCTGVHVDTFSFQALPFYERCGYTIFGCLPDYPTPHTRYFLHKRFNNG